MAAIMAAFAASTPLPSDYIKSDSRMFFSFHPENTSFQKGYLGIGITTISGTLHIRFPQAVAAKNITLDFIGRETVEWVDLKKIRAEKILDHKLINLWESSTELGYELVTDLDLPFEFEIPENAIESFNTQIVPLCRWSIPTTQDLRPLIIKSHARHRKVPVSCTCLKTFVQYFVDRRPEERRQKLHSKHITSGKEIMMTSMGVNTIFEANTMLKIPSNVPPTCRTKYMSIRNQIQIKVIFERLRHNVMITRDVVVGRNFLDDKSAADMRESMDYFSDSELK